MIAIDHVILMVDDLDRAAEEMLQRHGLASIPGGRHPGHGTGNRIVPLGAAYLELMAVVEPAEADRSPLGRFVLEHASSEPNPTSLCLRTDDIGPIATALGEEPLPMSRATPDGRTLSWLLAGLSGMLGPGRLPFFIEWQVAPGDHPGEASAPHTIAPRGIASVTVGRLPATLAGLVSEVPGLVEDDGPPGIGRVVVSTDRGDVVLGG
ncbi:MAG: VOC family protein [Acidimicrobiia bacterium]|nr:MAG: VOC family protein [Acidimicrobiia bacterium]